jgi:hypothetical protein
MRVHYLKVAVRRLAVVLACTFAVSAAAFSDNESVSRWMGAYYQSPEPQRLRDAVNQFVSDRVRLAHPERLDAPAHFFAVVAKADRQAQRDLQALADELPAGAGKQFVERVLRQPGRIEFMRARDPNDLDILWAHFAATGSTDAAKMVISALDFQPQHVDLSRPVWRAINVKDAAEGARLMRGAAAWSLAKHAQSHRSVKEMVEREVARAKDQRRRAQWQGILDGKVSLK